MRMECTCSSYKQTDGGDRGFCLESVNSSNNILSKEHIITKHNIQTFFQMRESEHNLRGICMFKQQLVRRTNAKYHCISVKGVNVKYEEELKQSMTWNEFKQVHV